MGKKKKKNLSDIYTDMDQVLWKDVTLFDVNEIWVEFIEPLEFKLKQTNKTMQCSRVVYLPEFN